MPDDGILKRRYDGKCERSLGGTARSFFPPSAKFREREKRVGMAMLEQGEHARQAAAAGTAITRLHRDHYGRGASTTRVIYQRNFLTVYLEDIYTPGERTLINAGRHEAVKSTRQEFQMTMRQPFSDAVEEATGRKVVAFMSQVHFDPDMAAEIFVLQPTKAETAETP
jgi:uncharacterized protein YbcI